jgi:hypothetical protein
MESCSLAHLSSDFWIDISPFLTSIELGRLSMIGCKLLFDKFTSAISSFVHRPRLQRRYSLPSLFLSFSNLLHLEIALPFSGSYPEWRTISGFGTSLLPKSLKSLNLNLDRVGNGKWLQDWIPSSSTSYDMTLDSLLPNLTSFTFVYQGLKIQPISSEFLLSLLSLPLIRLSLPRSFRVSSSHISTFFNHHTLLDLEIALLNDSSSSPLPPSFFSSPSPPSLTSPSITFPPNLTRLHIYNLPTKFPFILLPRTLLDLHVEFAHHDGNDDDDADYMEIDPERLKDWPPNLTKLSVYFGGVVFDDLYLTSAIASSLPRSLLFLNWEIEFFENPDVLREMPPKLKKFSTTNQDEHISEAIPLLPKALTSIQSKYLRVISLWKYLPRTITSIEYMEGFTSGWNDCASSFIQDLPPSLTSLRSYISFIQPSCPLLENITRLIVRLEDSELPEKWKIFFNVISTQLPHLEWLDLGLNDLIDMELLDILQQPLKTLQLRCDPRTLNFTSGKWSQSLQVLHIRTPYDSKSAYMDIDAFIE